MTKQTIGLGAAPTGAGGDTNRSGFTKANSNFSELYDFLAGAANASTLPASLAAAINAAGGYAKANILGAVGHSGGVPTGAIIEKGSNANGNYTKFADGTMICFKRLDLSSPISNAIGSVFFSSIASTDMPAVFYGAIPVFSVCHEDPTGLTWTAVGLGGSTSKFPGFFLISPSSIPTRSYTANLVALGRWF